MIRIDDSLSVLPAALGPVIRLWTNQTDPEQAGTTDGEASISITPIRGYPEEAVKVYEIRLDRSSTLKYGVLRAKISALNSLCLDIKISFD